MKSKFHLIAAAAILSAAPSLAASEPSDGTDSSVSTAAVAEPVASEGNDTAAAPRSKYSLAPTAPADGCELHIWPAERMASQTRGWLSGFGILGALADASAHAKTDSNNQSLLATALDSPSQLDSLLELDLRTELARSPGTTIILHDGPLERKTMNKVKTRRSESKAGCYSELIVADVLYQKSAIYGRSLKTLFMFRDFGADQKIDKEYKAWGGNGLKLFPPKEGEDAIAALGELSDKFELNFSEYANNARKKLVVAKK